MAVRVRLDTKKMDDLIQATESPVYEVHDGVHYGVYQEFTSSGHPSLVPAMEKTRRVFRRVISEALERGVSLDDAINKMAKDVQTMWASDVNVDTGAYKNSITTRKVK